MYRIIFFIWFQFFCELVIAQDTIFFSNKYVTGEFRDNKMFGVWNGYDSIIECDFSMKVNSFNTKFGIVNLCKLHYRDSLKRIEIIADGIIDKKELLWHGEVKIKNSKLESFHHYSYGNLIGLSSYYSDNYLTDLRWSNDTLNEISILLYQNRNEFGLFNLSTRNKQSDFNGQYIDFYSNGVVKEQGLFLNGAKVGEWSSYYLNGKLCSRGNFVNDFVDKSLEKPYKFLNKDGINVFDIYPKLKIVDFENITCRFYLKDGVWNYFDENGNLSSVEKYKKGILVSTKKYKNKKGK
jgi:antitoxin component YwqK of YwqJK toxin-antitoxin module